MAQQFFPYYRKHLAGIFDSDAQRELAWRVLKLLALVSLSPARDGLSAEEAAYWLLFAAARVDPGRNLKIVERVLDNWPSRAATFRSTQGATASISPTREPSGWKSF